MAGITQKVNNKLIYIKVPCRNGYKEKALIKLNWGKFLKNLALKE